MHLVNREIVMGLEKKGNIQYVTFEHFKHSELVNHCFTTRLGGVSEGCYGDMNLSFTRGEDTNKVKENYRILSDALGFDYDSFVLAHQTHTTNIRVVTEQDIGKGLTKDSDIRDTDALITNLKGVNLTIFGADCVPIFFLDPIKKAIGVSHAGWRGTAEGMAKKTVEKLQDTYGVDPKDLLVGIGPSIGKCCFQVDEPVVSLFQEKLDFAEELIFPDLTEKGKYKIDLWETNKRILMEAGVLEKHIEISEICTMCHLDLFYSHRVMGNDRGNMAGILTLK